MAGGGLCHGTFGTMVNPALMTSCLKQSADNCTVNFSDVGTAHCSRTVVEWLGRRIHDSRVKGSPPSHDIAWLFISETGDRLWQVNCLGNCNHHLGQLSLASPRGR